MAEITVKLLADAQELLQGADDAVSYVEKQTPVLKLEADSTEFLAGVKKAVNEAQKLQPTIRITGLNGNGGPGTPPGSGNPPGGSPSGSSGGGTGHSGSQAGITQKLLDFMKQAETQNNKRNEALTRSIEELSRQVEKGNSRTGGLGRNGGSGGGTGTNGVVSGNMNDFMRYLNMRPTGENGTLTAGNVLGTNGSGVLGMLGQIPLLGGIAGAATSVTGLISLIVSLATRHSDIAQEARQQALSGLENMYDVYGSVQGFRPEDFGGTSESYSIGMYSLMRGAADYGYDFDTSLTAADAIMEQAGYHGQEAMNADLESTLSTSRALGLDTESVADVIGLAQKTGYQDAGEDKITPLLARVIDATGMGGREEEMLGILRDQLEQQKQMNSHVSEQATQDWLNLYTAAVEQDPHLAGERGAEAVDSAVDYFTDTNNMTMYNAARQINPEYQGMQGYLKYMQDIAENPTAVAASTAQGLKQLGVSEDVIKFTLAQQMGADAVPMWDTIDIMMNGESASVDFTDSSLNQSEGQSYIDENLKHFDSTVGPYLNSEQIINQAALPQGTNELEGQRTWREETVLNLTASGIAAENEIMGQQGNVYYANKADMNNEETANLSTQAEMYRMTGTYQAPKLPDGTDNPIYQDLYRKASRQQASFDANDLGFEEDPLRYGEDGETYHVNAAYNVKYDMNGNVYDLDTGALIPNQTADPTTGDVRWKTDEDNARRRSVNTADTQKFAAMQMPDASDMAIQAYQALSDKGISSDVIKATMGAEYIPAVDTLMSVTQQDWSLNTSAVDEYMNKYALEHPESNEVSRNAVLGMAQSALRLTSLSGNLAAGSTQDVLDLSQTAITMTPSVARQVSVPPYALDTESAYAQGTSSQLQDVSAGNADRAATYANYLQDKGDDHLADLFRSMANPTGDASGTDVQSHVSLMQTGTPDAENAVIDYADLLKRNTDELKKNTEALTGKEDDNGIFSLFTGGLGTASTASDEQILYGMNAQRDAMSNSVSYDSTALRGVGQLKSSSPIANIASGIVGIVNDVTQAVTGSNAIDPSGKNGTATNAEPIIEGVQSIPNAVGNDYVPYDGYPATLHRGEMILRRDEAELVRQGRRLDTQESVDSLSAGLDMQKPSPLDELDPFGSAFFGVSPIDRILSTPSEPQSEMLSFEGGSINININVTGEVQGMDPGMQRQMVESIQAQIAGSGLRDMVSNGFTRRQNR